MASPVFLYICKSHNRQQVPSNSNNLKETSTPNNTRTEIVQRLLLCSIITFDTSTPIQRQSAEGVCTNVLTTTTKAKPCPPRWEVTWPCAPHAGSCLVSCSTIYADILPHIIISQCINFCSVYCSISILLDSYRQAKLRLAWTKLHLVSWSQNWQIIYSH